MTAYNVVRFRPEQGRESEFESLFKELKRDFAGLRKISLIKTEDGSYFTVGEWDDFESIKDARPAMTGNLDRFRHTLLNQGEGKGVTDAISGTAIYESTTVG